MSYEKRQRACQMVSAPKQRGFVLLIAMIALVALSLAGLGLMRSLISDSAISGNLVFHQSTINTGDFFIDDAMKRVIGDPNVAATSAMSLLGPDASHSNNPKTWNNQGNYYLATMLTQEDPVNPASAASLNFIKTNGIPVRLLPANTPLCTSAASPAPYTYIVYDSNTHNCAHVMIERMCSAAAAGQAASVSNCITVASVGQNTSGKYVQSHNTNTGGTDPGGNKVAVRVSVRVDGPRGTTTYLQAIFGQRII
jgi:hypothetical protein